MGWVGWMTCILNKKQDPKFGLKLCNINNKFCDNNMVKHNYTPMAALNL